MNTNEWYTPWVDTDKQAMLHVEGREPKLIVQNWQWKAIQLHKQPLMHQEVK